MKTKSIIGIDLGTTYSAIAEYLDGIPRIIPTRDGATLASAVAYRPNGQVVVGREAKKFQAECDRDVVTFTKRNMGNPHYGFPAHGRTYTPVEVSAEVLKALKADAEKHLGRAITDVVITVPAYFQAPQRDDTFAAGRLAGLNVTRLIDEPTAATLAIALAARASGRPLEGRVLVYDLGGGTFDVSVVDLPKGGKHIRVLAFKGDSYLGGKNFDDGLTNIVRAKAREQHGVELIDDPRKSSQWVALIEPFKIALSTADAVDIPVGPGDARSVKVARAEYEAVSQALLNQTVMLSEGALRDADERDQFDKRRPPRQDPLPAHLAWQQLDHVLLVGGMTRTPMVNERLATLSRKTPRADVNPDEAVALGAACAAAIAAGELPPDTLEEINAHTLGVIATARGGRQFVNSPVLPRNRPIPCTGSRDYLVHTAPKVPNDYTLFVTQGENRDPRSPDVKFLRKRRVKGIPHTPAGKTRITVSIGYDGNATEVVTAKTPDGTALDVVTEPVQQADVELFRAGRPPQPVAVTIATVLAVDTSGSMSSRGKLAGVQGKGKEFVSGRLRTSSGMGVVSFNGESRVVCPLTTDAGTLHAAIDGLRAFGNTYSAPALDHAFRLLAPVAGARRIVLLTDGQAADEAETEAAAERCRAAGIALHIIATQDANLPFLDRIGDLLPADDAGLGARLADIPEEVGGPNDWDGQTAQDDPLPEMIALPPKAENLFLALDAPPDSPAADLSPRLATRQGAWTIECDHQDPDTQTRARLRLEQVPAFRRIIDTPDRLKAEADDARRLLQEAATRQLQRADELVRQYGADELCLTTPEVKKVAAQTGLPEARVRALVVDHKFDVVDRPPPPPFPLLDSVQWHRVASNLKLLHEPDLYHLLGGTPQGDPTRLAAEATRLYEKHVREGGTTPDAQTQMGLYAEARTIFADPDLRTRYDNSRAFAAMEPVREKIVGRAGASKRLSFDAQTTFRNDLHAAWPNKAAVDAFLEKVAADAGIFLEGKKRPGPRPLIQVRCPVCQKLADEQAAACPGGHPMFPPCPKCKTANHVTALACGCGQNLRCRPEAEDLARLAERLHSAGNIDEAGQQAARALALWPGLPSAAATRTAVVEKVKADASLREATVARIRQAVAGRRLLAALGDLALAPEDAATRELQATATAGRDKAMAKVKEGDNLLAANRPDAAFAAFEDAVALCVDLTDAQKGLMRCPAEPAGPVTVAPTPDGVALDWAPSPTRKGQVSYRAYLFDRPPGADPDGGTLIGETAEPRCAVRLPANAPHFVAVVAMRDGVPNPRATVAGPFLRPEEVNGVRAVAAPDEVTVSFDLPAGAVRVEVLRADERRPDAWGEPQVLPAGSSQYTDHTVENGRRYRYTVRAVYPLGDGTERTSPGVRCAAAPAERADPVTDLSARVERNRTARVTFTPPRTGEVLLFAAPTPPPFPPGTPLAETDLPAFGAQVRTASGRADHPLTPGREVFFTAVSKNGGVLTAGACFPALAVDPIRPPTFRYGLDSELIAEFPWPDGADEVVILTSAVAPPKAWDDKAATRVAVRPPESGRTATCRWTVESGADEIFVTAFAVAPRPSVGDWSARTYASSPTTAVVGGTRRTLRYAVRPVPHAPPRRGLLGRLFGPPPGVHPEAWVGVEVVIVPDRPTRLPDFEVRYLEGSRPLSRQDGRVVVAVPADDRFYGPDEPLIVRESFDAVPRGEFRLFPADADAARGWRLIDVPAE